MQARSQEVRPGGGGSINTSESIYPEAQIRERWGGGREVRQVPLAFSGPNTKRETPSGLMHTVTRRGGSQASNRGGGGKFPLAMGLIRAYTYRSLNYLHVYMYGNVWYKW